jgi:hypothetical protein
MLGAFILFVLFLTGLIETAIQLFGAGNVSNNCQRYVNNNPISGVSASTLAWLEQNSICELEISPANTGRLADTLRLKLVRRIQLLDSRHCFLHLDVNHVFASREGCVRPTCLGELITTWLYF